MKYVCNVIQRRDDTETATSGMLVALRLFQNYEADETEFVHLN